MLRTWGRRFTLAVMVLTRIPIRANLKLTPGDWGSAAVFFPLVGLLPGLAALLALIATLGLTGSPALATILALLAATLMTGALHLDGLADVCDGVFSGRGRERSLEIMKDSRVGSFGVAAVVFALLIKGAALYGLLEQSWTAGAAVLIAPMAGRLAIVLAAAAGQPARPDGAGRVFFEEVKTGHFLAALAMTAFAAVALLGWGALIALAAVLLTAAWASWRLSRRLGGLTGDCLGAVSELGEGVFLAALLALCWNGLIWGGLF